MTGASVLVSKSAVALCQIVPLGEGEAAESALRDC